MATMETITERDRIKTITTHYIDGVFVESYGSEVMDIIKPTNGQLMGRVTLGEPRYPSMVESLHPPAG